MNAKSKFELCEYNEFLKVCKKFQNQWEELERCYRDYDGDVDDWDGYFETYILRVQWIIENILPENHPAFDDYKTYEGLARFIVEECSEIDDECYRSFDIMDEAKELYSFICTIHEDYE